MFKELKRMPLEISQSIDQSRIIENGLKIKGVNFQMGHPGINDLREEQMVRQILKSDVNQSEILKKIL